MGRLECLYGARRPSPPRASDEPQNGLTVIHARSPVRIVSRILYQVFAKRIVHDVFDDAFRSLAVADHVLPVAFLPQALIEPTLELPGSPLLRFRRKREQVGFLSFQNKYARRSTAAAASERRNATTSIAGTGIARSIAETSVSPMAHSAVRA
jgi:hypothetical protein